MLKRFDIRGSFCDSDYLCGWITIGDSFCPKIKGIFSLLIKGREIDYLDLKEKVNCLKYCSKIILTQLYAILLSFVFPATITFSSPSPFTANDLRHDQLVQKDSVTIIDVRPPEALWAADPKDLLLNELGIYDAIQTMERLSKRTQ